MTNSLRTIGFDADDTLWHNERFFQLTQTRFAALLADHADPDHLMAHLLAAEQRNLGHYGYGVKGFTLSMIETAIEVTDGTVPGHVIAELLQAGQEMLHHPIDLLDHVGATIRTLAPDFRLLLITKGDLLDQERKLAQSGLGEWFDGVEIVSEKTPEIYARIFGRHPGGADGAMMVGNSLKSDVIPALSAGAWGVHVPHTLTWALEQANAPTDDPRYAALSNLGQLPDLLHRIS